MNKKITIQKQALAILFLGVFLFIHLGKAIHSHELTSIAYQDSPTEQVSSTADCPVCDFHLTKDTEHQVATIDLELPLPGFIQKTSFQSRRPSSIELTFSDRGPPALA
jgi:hypothetical protein